jgi:hypothetical protein
MGWRTFLEKRIAAVRSIRQVATLSKWSIVHVINGLRNNNLPNN